MTSSSVHNLDDEGEDEDLCAAAFHLNKDLVGDGEKQHDEEEQDAREVHRPSLEALLGPLPTAASLGISDSIHNCVGEEKENENGEEPCRRAHASHLSCVNFIIVEFFYVIHDVIHVSTYLNVKFLDDLRISVNFRD